MTANGKIYGKLDWFTCMFYNQSLETLFAFLRLPEDLMTDFLTNAFDQNMGYCTDYALVFEGVCFHLNFDEFLLLNYDYSKIWEYKFDKIRVDCSGSGLDYLRALAFHEIGEIEIYLNDISNFPGEVDKDFRVTRADFAFDFVNYEKCPDFVERLLDWFYKTEYNPEYRTSTGLIYSGRQSGLKYSLRSGDQHTVYLGTTRSLKLVRIYNKLLQYQKNGILSKELPQFLKDVDVRSWFRIEFQTRQKESGHYLFGFRKFEDILKILFNDYLIRDSHGNPLDFMFELYDWGSLQTIPYNTPFTEMKTVSKSIERTIRKNAFSIALFVARYGLKGLINLLNEEFEKLDFDCPSSARRAFSYKQKLSRYVVEEDLSLSSMSALDLSYNRIRLKI